MTMNTTNLYLSQEVHCLNIFPSIPVDSKWFQPFLPHFVESNPAQFYSISSSIYHDVIIHTGKMFYSSSLIKKPWVWAMIWWCDYRTHPAWGAGGGASMTVGWTDEDEETERWSKSWSLGYRKLQAERENIIWRRRAGGGRGVWLCSVRRY